MKEKVEFYKETEFGEFPKDWEVKMLSEIAILERGLSYSSKEKSKDEIPDGYLFLTLNSIGEGGGLKECGWTWIKSERLRERHFIKEGDIVIANTEQSKDGSLIGSPAIVHLPKWYKKDKAVFSMDLSKLLLKISNMDVNFLFYYLSFVQLLARKYHTGTNVWHLKIDSWASDLLIPLPPLCEQQKIAEILSTIDETIQKTDEIIDKTESLKKGLMQELFTKGIGHKEFKETEIGKIPKDWEIKRLKDIVIKAKMGGTPRRNISEYWNGNIPFVKIEDITMSGKYLYNTEEFITEKGLENSSVWIVPKDSLLLAIYGSLGSIGINKIDVATNQAIVGIIPNNDILGIEFLYYYYLYFKPYWYKFIKKSTQPNLTLGIILDSLVPIPPLEEQKKIAEILSTLDKKLEVLKQEKVKLEKIKQWFMDELLTGKIRVRVS